MTTYLDTTTAPERFIGSYGTDWKNGLLSEHLDMFARAGGVVRGAASGSGAAWAVVDGVAYPVVCSEIISVPTEDGPVSGRCGHVAVRLGACADHAEVIEAWQAQSEAETAAWERSREEAWA